MFFKEVLVGLFLVLFASVGFAQMAPFSPYSSCHEPARAECFERKKKLLMRYYSSEVDIAEEKAKRLRYYDLLTEAETQFVIDARLAAEKEQQLAENAGSPALRQMHLKNAKREQAWADRLAEKFVGGTLEAHRENRKTGRDEIEAKFDEDLRVFQAYRAETWY